MPVYDAKDKIIVCHTPCKNIIILGLVFFVQNVYAVESSGQVNAYLLQPVSFVWSQKMKERKRQKWQKKKKNRQKKKKVKNMVTEIKKGKNQNMVTDY